jgi:hypothetical protein
VSTAVTFINEVKLILIQESVCAYFERIYRDGKKERCMEGFGAEMLRKKFENLGTEGRMILKQ